MVNFYTNEFRIEKPDYNSDHDKMVSYISKVWLHNSLVQASVKRKASVVSHDGLPKEEFFNKSKFYIIGAGILYRLPRHLKLKDIKILATPNLLMRDKIFQYEGKSVEDLITTAFTTVLERSTDVFRWKVDLTLNETLMDTLVKHEIAMNV